jgi:hypothetical protein
MLSGVPDPESFVTGTDPDYWIRINDYGPGFYSFYLLLSCQTNQQLFPLFLLVSYSRYICNQSFMVSN